MQAVRDLPQTKLFLKMEDMWLARHYKTWTAFQQIEKVSKTNDHTTLLSVLRSSNKLVYRFFVLWGSPRGICGFSVRKSKAFPQQLVEIRQFPAYKGLRRERGSVWQEHHRISQRKQEMLSTFPLFPASKIRAESKFRVWTEEYLEEMIRKERLISPFCILQSHSS